MGRLKLETRRSSRDFAKRWRSLNTRRSRQVILSWSLPAFIVIAILFGVHSRVKADPAPSSSELQQYLQDHQLNVYESTAGAYPQVFYVYQGHQIQLTSDEYIHLHPLSDGQYVTWVAVIDGQTQVFLEDVLSGSTLQLSQTSPNEGVSIYQNQVTWEGWDGQRWQVFYYDGNQVKQITSGSNSSFHAIINASQIVYSEQLSNDDWKAQTYDTTTGQTATVREGDTVSTAYPSFASDGTISTTFVPY